MAVLQNLSRAVEPTRAARAQPKAGRDTLMMSCDAPRQLTASSERFSRATPTIWSTGERAGQRLALKVHEVRRDVHRAYTRCRPTPGPARARPRRRDPLVSRCVGSGKRRRSGGARAEAPEVRGGRGLLREPVPRAGAGGQRVRARPRRRDLFVLESEKRVLRRGFDDARDGHLLRRPAVHGRRRAQGRPGHRVRAPRGVGPRPARAAPAAP